MRGVASYVPGMHGLSQHFPQCGRATREPYLNLIYLFQFIANISLLVHEIYKKKISMEKISKNVCKFGT